ncbi:AGE family epimerase/isomerase, partial [uncultured Brevundimonas sp.]|uniref:AGE family epimerase/isomerase n=1 Tax=uncultured Brevundimonas sp. TaxID=213418 RepID=UPI00261DBD7C
SVGLFAERTTREGAPDSSYFRTFVQARQIYSIITAKRHGWSGNAEELVRQSMAVILKNARRADGLYVHRLSANGEALDGRADLYDQAFVLFGMAYAGQALSDELLFDRAEELLDALEHHWADPAGGFFEGEIVDNSIRRQNPHMHLLEAFNALHTASGRQRFGDAGVRIAELCRDKFIDPTTGALKEYFAHEWLPLDDERGEVVEPGHCFEWAWLFEALAQKGWSDAVMVSDRMTGFARDHGICKVRNVAMNEILLNGRVRSAQARLWPQTERLKVACARYGRTGRAEEAWEIVAAYEGLKQYYLPEAPWLWMDKLNEDFSFVEEMVPASSLYHISCGVSELLAVSVVEAPHEPRATCTADLA